MKTLLTLTTSAFLLFTNQASLKAAEEMKLWPDAHPANQLDGQAAEEVAPNRVVIRHSPTLTAYLPENNPTKAAVMVVPGGGYSRLALDHEGREVAAWLNRRGVAAFVLRYRCGGGPNTHPAPLDDALRGMRTIRANAEKWNIDPAKVGVWGFSAGGHLASCVSTLADEGDSASDDPVQQQSSRANFSVLVYPVISMQSDIAHGGSRKQLLGDDPSEELMEKLTTYNQVDENTPPTFLIGASDDRGVVPENSLRYYQALLAANVPAEIHQFEGGGHGFGMRITNSPTDLWLPVLEGWLQTRGVIQK